ncbi:hypothetical protein KI387_037725 [Taxus chinensis]|uniref:Alpha/beta hydrolase fold-3 domain-containing protein n=1 Tax=Taxus chinensis TaxID=29808 RepID=A0AA38KWC7_TAXCH|nr:hypothetical protein KI387_037725 [Taxus chinensis]
MASNCDCVPLVVEEIPGVIKVYSDGSVVRDGEPSMPSGSIAEEDKVLNKDVVLNEEIDMWARIYLPPLTKMNTNTKVPILLYFHASGFCVLSPESPTMHRMCELWAAKLCVIIISVKYRLAPEHRLPAAYHDSIAALKWLQMQTQVVKTDCPATHPIPWLHDYADFSKIFVMGESAGGNIAHYVGMWAAKASAESEKAVEIKINGMILLYPFFGGEDRMPSEERGLSVFKVEQSDALWRLALPMGSNRDHPFRNPIPIGKGSEVAVSNLSLPPMLFVIGGRDLLRDKTFQY